MNRYPEIEEKLMPLDEAIRRFVKDGAQLALGGFTVNRNPMAAAYEIVRQGIGPFHIVCHSQGQALDVLVGAGCVKRLEVAYGANGRFASTCIRFKKAVEAGQIECEDYSNNQMSLRFLAGALGFPFMPSRSGIGRTSSTRKASARRQGRKRRSPRRNLWSPATPSTRKRA